MKQMIFRSDRADDDSSAVERIEFDYGMAERESAFTFFARFLDRRIDQPTDRLTDGRISEMQSSLRNDFHPLVFVTDVLKGIGLI